MKNESMCVLNPDMADEECETIIGDVNNIVPCWRFGENSKTIAFLEFSEEPDAILSVCLYRGRGNNIVLICS